MSLINWDNISTRVTLLSVVSVIISSIIVATLFYERSSEALIKLATQTRIENLKIDSARLKFQIEALRHDVAFLANTPPIAGIIRARLGGGVDPVDGSTELVWKQRLADIFSSFLESKEYYFQVRFMAIDNNGKELIRVDRDGENIIKLHDHLLQEKGDRQYFKDTIKLAKGQQYISEVNLNREHGEITTPHTPVIRAAIPIYAPDETLFGIVIINMDFTSVLNSLSRSEDETSQIYITNDQGDILAGPNKSEIFGFEFGRTQKIQDKYSAFTSIFTLGSDAQEVWELLLPDLDLIADGQKVFFDPDRPQRFLSIIATTSYSQLLQKPIEAMQGVVAITTALVFLTAGLAYGLSRMITRPLTNITSAVNEFAQGEVTSSLPENKQGEIGLLSNAFNEMVVQVQERSQQLQQSERYIREIVGNVLDGLISISQDGVIRSFSPAAESMFGYHATEVIGRDIAILMPLHERQEHQGHVNNYVHTSRSKVMGTWRELNGLHKSGRLIPLEVTLTQMEIDGEPTFIGLVRDISSRKKSDEEARLAAKVMNTALEAIIVTDKDNNITFVNEAFSEITGFSKEESIGKNPRIFKSGKHDKAFYQEMWDSLLEYGAWQGEIWDKKKDGEIFPKFASINCIRNSQGEITNHFAIFSDITERKAAEEHITNLAYFDTLTSLPNRRLFHDRLDRSIISAQRNSQNIALMFIDLDKFKNINDTLGHDAGDQILVQAASRLSDCVRKSDTVARFAGDEFTIILNDVNGEQNACRLAQKIIDAFSLPFEIRGEEIHSGASIGISLFPDDADDVAMLIKYADTAMYRAKQQGRNNYKLYSEEQ
ncbi:diguanylate cyclase domain-containing protein [Pseudomonadota bacterium]